VLVLDVLLEVDTLGLRVLEVTEDSEPTSERRLARLGGAAASIASMAALTSSWTTADLRRVKTILIA